MAPVAPLLLLLSLGAQAAPLSDLLSLPRRLAARYYGDEYGLSRPPPLPQKRGLSLPDGWSHAGCVTESHNERLLQGFSFFSASTTPLLCINECAKRGFPIAGTEYADECYCAKAFTGNGGVAVDDSVCRMPCKGNGGESCGAAWHLSLYTYNSTSQGSLYCGGSSTSVPLPTTTNGLPTTTTTDAPPTTTTTTTDAPPGPTDTTTTKHLPTTTDVPPETTVTTATTTTTAEPPVKTDVPQSNDEHLVWAHHMVGNTYPYNQQDWVSDISAAAAQAIDGFALNMGTEDWQKTQVASAYSAAEANGGSFKLFMSFDMTSMGCNSQADANVLINLVSKHASSSAQAKFKNKVLVSTFSGSDCTFGTGSNHGWQTAFIDPLKSKGISIFFVPSVFTDPGSFAQHQWMDGELNWNSAWPMGNHNINQGSTDPSYINALAPAKQSYMTAVSPYFFTHFGANTWNKNWLYRSDDWLYCTRWEEIIALRSVSTMTEILTWNDYGESSYIGPIRGDLPPTSGAWVHGFDHTALAEITKYYATAYKTGAYPKVQKDSLVMWSRPHPAKANAGNDPVGRPTNYEWTDDNLYAVVFATAPATVTLTSGSNSQTFSVSAGLNKLKIPSAVGSIGGKIERDGQTVASYSSGSAFQYTNSPSAYNYNYFVGASN